MNSYVMCPPTRWCDHTYVLFNMNVVHMYLLQDLLAVSDKKIRKIGSKISPIYVDIFVNCSSNNKNVLNYYQNIVFKNRNLLRPNSSRASNCILFSTETHSILEIQIVFLPCPTMWSGGPT